MNEDFWAGFVTGVIAAVVVVGLLAFIAAPSLLLVP